MRGRWGIGLAVAGLLTGCGVVAPSAGGPPRPLPPALPTQAIDTAVVRLVAQARARTAWAAQASRARLVTEAPVPPARPSSASVAPAPAPHPATPSASVPAAPAGLPMRDIPVYDPVNAYQQTPPAGAVVGFVTTIDTATLTVTIGPGWVWNPTLNNGQGGFAEIYPGGTVTLPASLTPNAYGGYDFPQICEIYPAGNPYGTVTVGVYGISAADPPPTGAYGLINGTCFASVGESWVGPGYNLSFSQPVWESFENNFLGLTWSGASYGSGTPTLATSAPASGS